MLGDHIRKRRLDLGLFQKQVAERIGVDKTTVYNWECHKSSPQVHQLPAVIRFLGYKPFPSKESFSEKLTAVRRALGLNQTAMARRLGIDPGTLRSWENRKRCPSKKLRRNIGHFL